MRVLRTTVLAVAAIALAGCATPRTMAGVTENANDPFENWNRAMFNFTIRVDKAVFRPTAIAYRDVVPMWFRDSLRNFLNNLDSPVILANDILQGNADAAKVTLVRASVNTTLGLAGFVDVAQRWGFVRQSEDFGQTLGVYGVGEGPYIFVPLVGPANPRDLLGRGVDILIDPFTWWQFNDRYWAAGGRVGLDFLDLRARNIDSLDELERSSIDFYASVRNLYRQSRDNEIRNGMGGAENLPDF